MKLVEKFKNLSVKTKLWIWVSGTLVLVLIITTAVIFGKQFLFKGFIQNPFNFQAPQLEIPNLSTLQNIQLPGSTTTQTGIQFSNYTNPAVVTPIFSPIQGARLLNFTVRNYMAVSNFESLRVKVVQGDKSGFTNIKLKRQGSSTEVTGNFNQATKIITFPNVSIPGSFQQSPEVRFFVTADFGPNTVTTVQLKISEDPLTQASIPPPPSPLPKINGFTGPAVQILKSSLVFAKNTLPQTEVTAGNARGLLSFKVTNNRETTALPAPLRFTLNNGDITKLSNIKLLFPGPANPANPIITATVEDQDMIFENFDQFSVPSTQSKDFVLTADIAPDASGNFDILLSPGNALIPQTFQVLGLPLFEVIHVTPAPPEEDESPAQELITTEPPPLPPAADTVTGETTLLVRAETLTPPPSPTIELDAETTVLKFSVETNNAVDIESFFFSLAEANIPEEDFDRIKLKKENTTVTSLSGNELSNFRTTGEIEITLDTFDQNLPAGPVGKRNFTLFVKLVPNATPNRTFKIQLDSLQTSPLATISSITPLPIVSSQFTVASPPPPPLPQPLPQPLPPQPLTQGPPVTQAPTLEDLGPSAEVQEFEEEIEELREPFETSETVAIRDEAPIAPEIEIVAAPLPPPPTQLTGQASLASAARLRSAPERGDTGPGMLAYIGILTAVQAVYYWRKNRMRK